jgi:hypothetical protein
MGKTTTVMIGEVANKMKITVRTTAIISLASV